MHLMISAPEIQPRDSQPSVWYAVYTKHQHEKNVSDLLARKGFTVFLPLYNTERRWKDRTKIVSLPIFPCYLFLRTNLDRKLDILRTPGVFWLVENDGHASAIPESEIEAVRKITENSARVEPHPYPSLKDGDFVRIRRGPLAGIQGILTRVKNRYRVVLSVEVLQKAVAVEVELSSVEPVNSPCGIVPPPQAELSLTV
jgi:transcription antitermination factor NusG